MEPEDKVEVVDLTEKDGEDKEVHIEENQTQDDDDQAGHGDATRTVPPPPQQLERWPMRYRHLRGN